MKIVLLAIGKTDANYFSDAFAVYQKRLKHYITFETEIIPDIKNSKNLSEEQQKTKEGELFLKHLNSNDFLILLDDKGKEYTSMGFATYIEKKMHLTSKKIVFAIGGPYGFSDEIYNRANDKLTLSRLTFTHQMVRLVFIEQLYRAMTILNNEPYHHE